MKILDSLKAVPDCKDADLAEILAILESEKYGYNREDEATGGFKNLDAEQGELNEKRKNIVKTAVQAASGQGDGGVSAYRFVVSLPKSDNDQPGLSDYKVADSADCKVNFAQLTSGVGEHFKFQLYDRTYELRSGKLKVDSNDSLDIAVRLATDWEQMKKKPSMLVTVPLQLDFGVLKRFSDYTVEMGMLSLLGPDANGMQRNPKRVTRPFFQPVSLKDKYAEVIDDKSSPLHKRTVKELLQQMAQDQLCRLTVVPWAEQLKEAGRRLHIDSFLVYALVLLTVFLDGISLQYIRLKVEHKLKGRDAAGPLDYVIRYLEELVVMLEAKTDISTGHGQLLGQMGALKSSKRTRSEAKVFGILSSGKEWAFFECDIKQTQPVQYYQDDLVLTNVTDEASLLAATEPVLEKMIGFLMLCFRDRENTVPSTRQRV